MSLKTRVYTFVRLSDMDVRFLSTPIIVSCQRCGTTYWGSSLNIYVEKGSGALNCNDCAGIMKDSPTGTHTIE